VSKEGQLARYTLPDVVDPSDSVCYMVPVPNDKFHIAAFKGQVKALASAYAWGDDTAHTALDVAAVWRIIFDNLEPCEMVSIRLKPTDFCMVQLSTDGGTTWSDVADLSSCAHAAAVSEIQDALDRGDLSGGGQQPGQGSGAPGQCYDYDITINGNDRWLAPVAIEAGDIVDVTVRNGAWWHGDVTHLNWNCPDGTYFGLGNCFGSGYTDSADPLPSELKMRLIGYIPGASTPYFDMYNTSRTIDPGVTLSDFYLQPNDDNLADNQGSVSLHVQICKSLWTHTFTGSDLNTGFSIFNDGTYGPRGSWDGTKFVSVADPVEAGKDWLYIVRNFPAARYLYYEVVGSLTATGAVAIIRIYSGANLTGSIVASSGFESQVLSSDQTNPGSILIGDVRAAAMTITSVIFRGTGVDPF